MRKILPFFALLLCFVTVSAWAVDAQTLPKKKTTTQGLYLTSHEAYELMQKETDKTLFVDVRTRAEVNFLGMPTVADANIPYMKLSEWYAWDDKKKQFKLELNDQFLPKIKDRLTAKGLTENDRIVFICRSGSRSAAAANLLAKAGYKNVYTVVDGYEGDKAKQGPQKGQRVVNGWKNNGLPWSYSLLATKMYMAEE
ncbi:MAG: sulfurtransferase [Gammaproteobacteria bacterium]|jgi:rhodanese-related sulfurtransferase|nr:sulfurtransferase [Gammaproteobacteria bacterium]